MLIKDLKLGEKAIILDSVNNCKNPICKKLFSLGFIPDTEITLVRIAPFGDSMQITSNNNISVSIRKSEAGDIEIEKTL